MTKFNITDREYIKEFEKLINELILKKLYEEIL